MSTYKNIDLLLDEGILTITINRPDKLNALNNKTLEELKNIGQDLYDNKEIKGVILTGSGDKAFVAGADILEFSGLNEVNARKFSENGQEVFNIFEESPKPIIALVNGYALGGGCELAMACHIRIATANAKFGLPEVTLGIIPAYGGTQRLTQLVGKGKAFELTMTGNMVSAEEAYRLGLVNYTLPTKEEALRKAHEILDKIVQNAPLAVGMVVSCINASTSPTEDGYLLEANSFANCCKSSDFSEGVGAFIKKRKAVFKGE